MVIHLHCFLQFLSFHQCLLKVALSIQNSYVYGSNRGKTLLLRFCVMNTFLRPSILFFFALYSQNSSKDISLKLFMSDSQNDCITFSTHHLHELYIILMQFTSSLSATVEPNLDAVFLQFVNKSETCCSCTAHLLKGTPITNPGSLISYRLDHILSYFRTILTHSVINPLRPG